jgi:2-polyprenyl-3-methyl-5-hydroxy-6-metoxy-1,4-benzoquinol methylase
LGFQNLIGIDVGPEQIAIARARGVTVIQASILEYLQASDESFDLILAFDIIEHFTKDEVLDLLGLIWKRLRPGGRLVIQTPNALSPWASHYRYHDLTHELIFDPHCLASTLRSCGFKDIKLREVGPYIHGIVSAVRWVLWKFVRAGYIAVNCIESGGSQGGVYTRNMLVSALKGEPAE